MQYQITILVTKRRSRKGNEENASREDRVKM
jgi:hypothetical protein